MKALTVKGYWWFWAMEHAGEDVENRTLGSNQRGMCFIHISKQSHLHEYQAFVRLLMEIKGRLPSDLPSFVECKRYAGKIVGAVLIRDCISTSTSPWFFGPRAFQIKHVSTLPHPVYCRGALNFWDVPIPVFHAARVQLKSALDVKYE